MSLDSELRLRVSIPARSPLAEDLARHGSGARIRLIYLAHLGLAFENASTRTGGKLNLPVPSASSHHELQTRDDSPRSALPPHEPEVAESPLLGGLGLDISSVTGFRG